MSALASEHEKDLHALVSRRTRQDWQARMASTGPSRRPGKIPGLGTKVLVVTGRLLDAARPAGSPPPLDGKIGRRQSRHSAPPTPSGQHGSIARPRPGRPRPPRRRPGRTGLRSQLLLDVHPRVVRVQRCDRVDRLLGDVLDPRSQVVLVVVCHHEVHAGEVPATRVRHVGSAEPEGAPSSTRAPPSGHRMVTATGTRRTDATEWPGQASPLYPSTTPQERSMLFRRLLLLATIAAVLCSAAFVAGNALEDGSSARPTASGTGGVPTANPSPTGNPSPTATPTTPDRAAHGGAHPRTDDRAHP